MSGNEIDLAVEVSPYVNNYYNLAPELQSKEINKLILLKKELQAVKRKLKNHFLFENAQKHISACFDNIQSDVEEYVRRINIILNIENDNYIQDINKESLKVIAVNALTELTHFSNSYNIVCNKSDESEKNLLDLVKQKKLLEKHEFLNSIKSGSDVKKSYESKSIVKLLKRISTNKKSKKKTESASRHRFFIHKINLNNLCFNIVLNNVSLVQTRNLICSYVDLDNSNKIRHFFYLVHFFVKSHKIDDTSTGLRLFLLLLKSLLYLFIIYI